MPNLVSQSVTHDSAITFITSFEDAYQFDIGHFVRFLQQHKLTLCHDALRAYADYLDRPHDGKKYSAATINKRIAAVKNRIRKLMETQDLTLSQKYRMEQALKALKPKRTLSRPAVLDEEEVANLIQECRDKTISLIIEFLYATGLRISEAL